MKPVGWKVWYTQQRTFESRYYKWEDLPKQGVLSVVIWFDTSYNGDPNSPRHKEILSGKRRYFKAKGSFGNDFYKATLWKEKTIKDVYLTQEGCIKEGIWDENDAFTHANRAAMSEPFWDDLR